MPGSIQKCCNVLDVQPATTSAEPNSKAQEVQIVSDQPIPEGFFDDPILDAKVRIIIVL